jgi:2'-5' RNA ligase
MSDVTTALTIVIPPGNLYDKVNFIRRKYDRAYPRWMPHINLYFPFVPIESFDDVTTRLRDALTGFGPMELNLSQIAYFKQQSQVTFHLAPEDDSRLQDLMKVIREALPEIRVKFPSFNPHLTVAQCPHSETNRMEANLNHHFITNSKDWNPRVNIEEIQLISRSKVDSKQPFSVNTSISIL